MATWRRTRSRSFGSDPVGEGGFAPKPQGSPLAWLWADLPVQPTSCGPRTPDQTLPAPV